MDKNNNAEIFTVSDTAQYLKVAEKTVLRMIHKGEIPCAKVGGQWRFMRSVIDDWLISKMQVIPRTDLSRMIAAGEEVVPLSRMTDESLIVPDLKPGSREEVLRELVEPLAAAGFVPNPEEYLKNLLERESLVSTAIGRGIAIPHVRHPNEQTAAGPALAIGICREGIDYGAPDGEKTRLFFLLCTDSEVVHLRVMAKLTRLLSQDELPEKLLNADSPREVIQTLINGEQMLSLSGSIFTNERRNS